MNSSLRKIGKVLAGTLFTLFLSLLIIFFSFAQLTAYSSLKPYVSDIVAKQLTDDQKGQIEFFMQQSCSNSDSVTLNIVDSNVTVDCRSKNYIGELAGKSFDSFYYKNYTCGMLDCIRNPKTMLAAFSLKSNIFFNTYLLLLAVLTVFSAALMMFFLKGWGIPKGVGISMIFVGVNYFALGIIKNSMPKDMLSAAGPLINVIFDTLAANFLVVLIPGVVLAAVGIAGGKFSKKK